MRRRKDTGTQEKFLIKSEAEIRVIQLQAKKPEGLQPHNRNREREILQKEPAPPKP
jgi:hypothetical protein